MFKSFPISRISKGGETMKTFVLVLALMVVAAGVSVAATATIDVYPGWNRIAAPLVPFDPDPMSVLGDAVDGLDSLLIRYSPAEGGSVVYDELDPEGFAGILLGDGLQLFATQAQTFTYEGVEDGVPDAQGVKTDMWISLPGSGAGTGGLHMVGHPFDHDTAVDDGSGEGTNILFTDGTDVKTWGEANAANWVAGEFMGYNPSVGGGFSVQFDGLGDSDALVAGSAYQVTTFIDNLAMIIPAAE